MRVFVFVQLGPLGKVMSMIPGMSNIIGPGKEKESVERIKRFMTIMDSFTAEELDSDMKIFNVTPNRLIRIARGAGVQLRHVHEVLETYKPFKKVASNMGGLAQVRNNKKRRQDTTHTRARARVRATFPTYAYSRSLFCPSRLSPPLQMTNPKNGMLNPKAMQGRGGQMNMQKMASMFNPVRTHNTHTNTTSTSQRAREIEKEIRARECYMLTLMFVFLVFPFLQQMLQQMGGMSGLQNMMRQFTQGGGMGGLGGLGGMGGPGGPDMAEMMKMMGGMGGGR